MIVWLLILPFALSTDSHHGKVKSLHPVGNANCTKNEDCVGAQFCGLGNEGSKRCFKVPSSKHSTEGLLPAIALNDVVVCKTDRDCEHYGATCAVPTIEGQEYPTVKLCYPFPCPYGVQPKFVKRCSNSDCEDKTDVCRVKDGLSMCCPIHQKFKCYGTQAPAVLGEHSVCSGKYTIKFADGKCCRQFIYQSTGEVLPIVAVNSSEEFQSNNDCTQNFCGRSTLYEISSKLVGQPKHCYPVPIFDSAVAMKAKNVDLLTCNTHEDCSESKPGICESPFEGSSKLCFPISCPFWNTNQQMDKTAVKDCTSDRECGSNAHCVTTLGNKKHCCPMSPELVCPGGIPPLLGEDKAPLTKCDNYYNINITVNGETRCCDRPIFKFAKESSPPIVVFPVNDKKTCTKNADCGEGFCGESAKIDRNGKKAKDFEKSVKHCYTLPQCPGKVVKADDFGLKTCDPGDATTFGANTICTKPSIVDSKRVQTVNLHVQCHFECKDIPEAKLSTGKSKAVCECTDAAGSYCDCDAKINNKDDKFEICQETPLKKVYRLCEFERDVAVCPDQRTLIREKRTHALTTCTHDVDCRVPAKSMEPPMTATCVPPSSPVNGVTKMCCQADMCSDMYTPMKGQKVCAKGEDCTQSFNTGKEGKGRCLTALDGSKHCCPYADGSMHDPSVFHPFRLENRGCTSLKDCLGDGRFCDPFKKTCMYHGKTIAFRKRTGAGTCTKDKVMCDTDPRNICLSEELGNTTTTPGCYAHPLDECATHANCPSDKRHKFFCAPPVGASAEKYNSSLRVCHPKPDLAILSSGLGLLVCKNHSDCQSDDLRCNPSPAPTVAILPTFGYCINAKPAKCHGVAWHLYTNGERETCSKNSDCEASYFCDLDIDRTETTIPADRGVCCTRPKCGGTLPVMDVGIKTCGINKNCYAEGEACDHTFEKPRVPSMWDTDDNGVCCNNEAVKTTPLATFYCQANDRFCRNDDRHIRKCSSTGIGNATRCCVYNRTENYCANVQPFVASPVRGPDHNILRCRKDSECPDRARCGSGGFCCKVKMCKDGWTLKSDVGKCFTNQTCSSPKGVETECDGGYCCPFTSNGRIINPFKTNTVCRKSEDCPLERMFCDPAEKVCYHYGVRRSSHETGKRCEAGHITCRHNWFDGICVVDQFNGTKFLSCEFNSRFDVPEHNLNDADYEPDYTVAYVLFAIANTIWIFALGTMGFYVYYLNFKRDLAIRLAAYEKQERAKEKRRLRRQREARKRAERPAEIVGQFKYNLPVLPPPKPVKQSPYQFITF